MRKQLQASFTVAARSHNALASLGTAVVGLVVVPVMQTLLVVGAVGAAGQRDLAVTAQATIAVGVITFVAASIGVQTSMDRVTGVAVHVVPYGLLRAPMYAGKVLLAIVLALPATGIQLIGVAVTGASVGSTLLVLPGALLVGAVLGLSVSLWSIRAKDPFAIANLVPYVLPITSGAAVPLATYPPLLQVIGSAIPGAGVAHAIRGDVPIAAGVAWDLATSGAWLALTAVRAARISARARDGRLTADVL